MNNVILIVISFDMLKVLFHSSHFLFFVFGHFWQRSDENMKMLSLFARQDGQYGMKIKQLKWPKYQKPKDDEGKILI